MRFSEKSTFVDAWLGSEYASGQNFIEKISNCLKLLKIFRLNLSSQKVSKLISKLNKLVINALKMHFY